MATKKKPSYIDITFSVSGVCNQTIELAKDCPLTAKQIINGLNGARAKDSICTTVQENGELIIFTQTEAQKGSSRVLGKVVSSEMDADYTDFTLEDEHA